MRLLLSLAIILPSLSSAETFFVDTTVTEATIYPEGADIVRTGSFSVPAGNHQIILPGIPMGEFGTQYTTLRVQTEGLNQTARMIQTDIDHLRSYKSEAVRSAEARIDEIEERIDAVKDAAEAARLKARAAEQKTAFLSNLGHNEGLAGSGEETLRNIARMIGDEVLQAEQSAQSAMIEAREVEKQLPDLEDELTAAQTDLTMMVPDFEDQMAVIVDVSAEVATEGKLTVAYLDSYAANWVPAYGFYLTTGAAPEVRIDRSALIMQDTGENWRDVKVHVSTLSPASRNAVRGLAPIRRKIVESPAPDSGTFAGVAEPVLEAPVVVEETVGGLPISSSVEGTGFTYSLPDPVSVPSGSGAAKLALDTVTAPASIFALTAPAIEEKAYRTARFTNPLEETLMETKFAEWFVDDVLVAAGRTREIEPLEEVDMGFGPVHGLRVTSDVLDRSTGDAGIISRSNQRVKQTEIRIENLTDRVWPLRILDRVPYSEQDDLDVTWSTRPPPTEENVDNDRGILAWEFELEPGQSEAIMSDLNLSWPVGWDLH